MPTRAFASGRAPAARSYLNIPNIISAALISGADAVHPGYGFLAENARFAEICADHGLTFVGPAPETIAQMGDKATAKAIMRDANVPTTPGTDILTDAAAALAAAARARLSGHSQADRGRRRKGHARRASCRGTRRRVCDRASRSRSQLQRRAAVYGKADRAPAPYRSASLRRRLRQRRPRRRTRLLRAKAVASKADRGGAGARYSSRLCAHACTRSRSLRRAPSAIASAGTLEFLVSGDDVYFMEMNTRIQVEHPVTEMLYGVDLVREQIRVAAGRALAFRTARSRCRAVMPSNVASTPRDADFAPAAGTLGDVALPGGCGVRVDSHAYAGSGRLAILRFVAGQE